MNKPNWFISLLFGADPDKWELWKHKATGWQYWYAPFCEMVDVPKDRLRVDPATTLPFPMARAVLPDGTVREFPQMADQIITPGLVFSAASDGVGGGRPMQNGTSDMRPLSWGYKEWGQREETMIPEPVSGWYWTEGHPNPYFDRHGIVVAPNGDVHEMIQLDPRVDFDSPFFNQALGWGVWRDKQLMAGRFVTAADLPMHPYVWTPWSKNDPHRMSIVIGDYVGGDGTLSEGLRCGDIVQLDNASPSYAAMRSIGGECQAIAEALVTYGAVVIDRNGYTDISGNSKTGTKLNKPSIQVQTSRHWATSNIRSLKIRLGDLRVVASKDD